MKIIGAFLLCILTVTSYCQDVNVLLKEASNLERTQKENEAYEKYKQVLAADPNNMQSLIRSSELCSSIGGREPDKKVKKQYFDLAAGYANKALLLDSNSADANYVRAVAANKLTDVETETKKLVEEVKDIRIYAGKALAINQNHGKANYVFGKWNFDVTTMSWAKKAAVKVLFGGIGTASMDSAYKYMERCRVLEPYYVQNFLDLAKAYKSDYKPAKAIDVLNQLVKLPVRTADDPALKAEGKQILAEMQ